MRLIIIYVYSHNLNIVSNAIFKTINRKID